MNKKLYIKKHIHRKEVVMKIKQFNIKTWFIVNELSYKCDIYYENETKRAYDLLDVMMNKYYKIDNRRTYNKIQVTEEEYQTWYVYFLEYYIDDGSIYVGSKHEKESKRLLKAMVKFFGKPNFDISHRAGAMLGAVRSLINHYGETKALTLAKSLKQMTKQ
jgi:hypothetical protein|tara:strand:+ start:21 stop:503 length:483 start_codon:yes stop_codon:yes gene_type:complete